MKLRNLFLILVAALTMSSKAQASLEVGIGTSSFTGGRITPSLEFALSANDYALSWFATGMRNSYSYQSSHLVSYYQTWSAGTFLGGDMISGFGASAGYSVRSFQDVGAASEQKVSDYLLGPALRMSWSYGMVYFNFSATFGVRDLLRHLTSLTFQDVETLSVGIRL
jgi:hypothetical protein